ncbi:MAG: PSD1 and planctomycete cytochrome C domain-containing protein [Planctomycetaceae bacterium]
MHRKIVPAIVLACVVLPSLHADEKPEPYTKLERQHWSFQKPVEPRIPTQFSAREQQWIRNPIDAFVLRKLKEKSLKPASPANRRTLIRRVTYDLTGLPPRPTDIEAFLKDRSPRAYERLIERLLASPQYGERWAQHWLDVVRFAETEGFEYDRYRPGAWRYRDYVIRAFNTDKPYNQFLVEQLAGDELNATANPKTLSPSVKRERQVAVGFHRLGPIRRNAGNAKVAFSRNEVLTEMTDIVGTAFLGLTLGCARCHDHEFDPIRQKDYYRFQAFLAATHEYDVSLADARMQKNWQKQTDVIQAKMTAIKKQLASADLKKQTELLEQLKALESQLPAPLPVVFSSRNDPEHRSEIHLLERGEESRKGEKLGMRALGVLLPDTASELPPETSNPKMRLAKWIASSNNPLTARVMVNRIWQNHFGQGIVQTPNDFGANGSDPSHPELLDYLAVQFIKTGWSIKAMHRLILLSNTYRQSSYSRNEQQARAKDPHNRLLWKFNRRRLSAEEIRDSLLAVSGTLNPKRGGKSVIVPVDPELVKLLYKPSQWSVTADEAEHRRRSIYLIAKRNLQVPFLEVFDRPSLQNSCGRRASSTHAPQALELLNGKLSNQLAQKFANRLRREAGNHPEKQVLHAFVLAAGRPPNAQEKALSLRFLKTESLEEFALAMFNLNTFLYVE